MRLKIKISLFLSIFSACVLLYFLLPLLFPNAQFLRIQTIEQLEVFSSPSANFILVIIIFLLFSLALLLVFEFLCRHVNPGAAGQSKLGKYLVEENFITTEELNRALKEQNFKLK